LFLSSLGVFRGRQEDTKTRKERERERNSKIIKQKSTSHPATNQQKNPQSISTILIIYIYEKGEKPLKIAFQRKSTSCGSHETFAE